ncbi:dipeptidase E|nr:dipeptidase E [Candidatus Pantoea persica]
MRRCYAQPQPQLHAMIAQRGIASAVLVPYAIIRGDHQQRAAELGASLGVTVRCVQISPCRWRRSSRPS